MNPTRRQVWVLVLLTLVWGLNWPVMKLGVSGTPAAPANWPPLTFRALSMVLGLPVLAAALWWLKVPFRVPRALWGEVVKLALPNMIVWHVVVIVALRSLSSGRSAILAYTMPVFSALWGGAVFGDRLGLRPSAGVAAAALGVVLLLWSEFSSLGGAPLAALAMLGSACIWGLGTHLLRRSTAPLADAAGGVGDCLQRRRRVRLRARGLVLPGAQHAAGGVDDQRHDDPRAGHLQRRLGAGRGLALAGLRGHGADGAGHRRRAVAATRGAGLTAADAAETMSPWCVTKQRLD